ncbi:hypothetical protein MMUC44124_20665 [Mycolicibacterium mucogenicum DSM 44124]|uniref:Uncharacterized protein n=1 Tax=Mycolicibacterium mucogenicum DSM 44124 TaxID=1226753 RepID=A0A8H2JGL9_MYCMU|nr:hypothetical protein MMUC44124_20665 [Mycolicibacterium mucogenicum DSM 44124]
MQPVRWLYIRGMKSRVLAIAAAAAVLAACGGETPHSVGTTTAAATAATSTITLGPITTWPAWGKYGQELLAMCGESDWSCAAQAVDELAQKAKQLPAWPESNGASPDRVLAWYKDDYSKYTTNHCDAPPPRPADNVAWCAVAEQSLPTQLKTVRSALDRAVAG